MSLGGPCRGQGAVGLEGAGVGRVVPGEGSYLDTDDWRKSGSHCWISGQGRGRA